MQAEPDIKLKLEEELDQIRYKQKLFLGTTINETDIRELMQVLKSSDHEIKPLLDVLENLIIPMLTVDYLLAEKSLVQLLTFYNIISNNDLIKCRHKYYFTENKKLTKKQFFSPKVLEKVKDELSINGIFKKLQ